VSNFAVALRRAREAAALSQRALARRCGLTPAYLSLLEGGRRMPERPTVERIAAALGLNDAGRADLLLAAGYAAPAGGGGHPGPLAEAEALIADPTLAPEQRDTIARLTALYVRGLLARLRAGRPLVSDLAAPWQQRVLEAIDEQMAEDFESFRTASMRPLFDL
jgi:transcriptional regulator with XRE-family HTH domain